LTSPVAVNTVLALPQPVMWVYVYTTVTLVDCIIQHVPAGIQVSALHVFQSSHFDLTVSLYL